MPLRPRTLTALLPEECKLTRVALPQPETSPRNTPAKPQKHALAAQRMHAH